MNISWNSRDSVGRFGFAAEPEAYDGEPPIRYLNVDRDMSMISDDVLSLAGFLAFGPYCSGSVSLPRKVSPELARAIEQFSDPLWLQVSPVEFEPRKAPEGSGYAFVSDRMESEVVLPNMWGRPRNLTISVLDAAEWSGDLVATDRLFVASNAKTLWTYFPDRFRFAPFLAVALLYLESYRCTTLVVPDDAIEDFDAWRRVASLLNACKFGLLRKSEAISVLNA